jgi:diguanylate cyclase (GGDEF)-like protein/PAS domain S-box-containing protein
MSRIIHSHKAWWSFCGNLRQYAIVLLDEDGNVVAWNEGARLLKGYDAEEIVGEHFSRFYPPEATAVGHPERELVVAAAVGHYEEEGWRVRKDGTRFWAHVVINAIFDDNRVLCGFGKIVKDITDQKQAAEQAANVMKLLEYTARTDYLTGLDNRRSLDKLLATATSTARRHERPLCLAMIDFDKFKSFNDEFGHQAGDAYLKAATARWREALRPQDVIARYGGEEFVVLLPDSTLAEATTALERLRAITPPPLTCSIGLAEWDMAETQNSLLGRADHSVYQAKATGRDRLVVSPRFASCSAAEADGCSTGAPRLPGPHQFE